MNVKNRGCIRRLSIKTLLASRKRNLVAIAAIVLTTLLFTSLFTVAMSINSSYEMYTFRQIGGYCHGTFKEVTEAQAAAIAAHPKIKAVGKRTTIGFLDSGVFAKVPGELSFMDENCTKWSFATPDSGRIPQTGNEVSMDTAALSLMGIAPELGAQIPLTYTVGDKSQISYEKTDTFTLVGWWKYDNISPVHYINVSQEYARMIESEGITAGMDAFRTDLNVMLASAVDIRGQMEQVDKDLGYTWQQDGSENVVRIGVNWGYTTAQLAESMDATTVVSIAALLLLVIFTGYLIIYNIFQISVTGDIRYYGLLKTIGVTPRQLRRIIRWEALLLCAVGIPIGLLLGYGVGVLLTPLIMANTTFGSGITIISVSPLIFLASALFSLITVLLSCTRPGRIAAKVSPVEAAKYVDPVRSSKKFRTTRGAKIPQMAFANLGRNKSKTVLVVVSLALCLVLLNLLITFTGGFDMEKYLKQQASADFIVSSTDYFRFNRAENDLSPETIEEIAASTTASLSGCGYKVSDTIGWMPEAAWRSERLRFGAPEQVEQELTGYARWEDLVGCDAQIEGLDKSLFEKLTVVEGDLTPLFQENSRAIAMVVPVDDYGNVTKPENYPAVGAEQMITYVEDGYYIDSRTGEKCTDATPQEFLKYRIAKSHDAAYTVCAYVTLPRSMSYRYGLLGYSFVLPADRLAADSLHRSMPMFYLFDTPDAASEEAAEDYLAQLTAGEASGLMYESKAVLREEFTDFQNMFLFLGGLLCAIIGLVGILNFFNAIMTGILSRRREFAVLQAVGMTGRQLKSMLVWEGLCYALGAAGTALLLSVVLNLPVGNLMETAFWFFSAHFTIAPVLLAFPVFALLGYAVPAGMYHYAARQSIVERLREADSPLPANLYPYYQR